MVDYLLRRDFSHINSDDEEIIDWALKETGLEGMEEKLVMRNVWRGKTEGFHCNGISSKT